MVAAHIHESPLVMLVPLAFLAFGALFSGKLLHALFLGSQTMWNGALPEVLSIHHPPVFIEYLPVFLSLGGIGLAFLLYEVFPQLPALFIVHMRPLHQFLMNQWYFDKIYHMLIVKPLHTLSHFFWRFIDQFLIDGWGVHGATRLSSWASARISRMQTGLIQTHALFMLAGVFLFTLCLLWIYL